MIMVVAWAVCMRMGLPMVFFLSAVLFVGEFVTKNLRIVHNLSQEISIGNDRLVCLIQLLLVSQLFEDILISFWKEVDVFSTSIVGRKLEEIKGFKLLI